MTDTSHIEGCELLTGLIVEVEISITWTELEQWGTSDWYTGTPHLSIYFNNSSIHSEDLDNWFKPETCKKIEEKIAEMES